MKKRLLFLAVTLMMMTQMGFSQYEGGHAVSFKYVGNDTWSPYANVEDNGDLSFKFDAENALEDMTPGIEIGYHYGIKDWMAISIPFNFGMYRQRFLRVDSLQQETLFNKDLLFGSIGARYKFSADFMPKQILVPYVSSGVDVLVKENRRDTDVNIPLELGLNVRLADNFFLSGSTSYRWSVDEIRDDNNRSFTNNMMHSVGFLWTIGDREEATPPPPPPPPVEVEVPSDKDGDGIVDAEDTCPEVAGLAKFAGCPDTDGDDIQDSADDCPEVAGLAAFKGCPDTDGDGLSDNNDDCPTEAGTIANKGCPVVVKDRDGDGVPDDEDACPDKAGTAAMKGCPDTDGDGVADKSDQCPSTPGLAKFNGCPDTDGDGVADKSDKCPTTAGTVANNGCPEIKQEDKATLSFATQAIEFETGSNVIRTSSYPILDQIAGIMAKYPDYSLSISGYTDNVGNDNNNLTLSQNRADACKAYLVKKGVSSSRMVSTGYGEASPVADNATKEGRQRNRRVELSVFLR